MKRTHILFTIIFISLTFCMSCEVKNKQQQQERQPLTPIASADHTDYDTLCDSIIESKFIDDGFKRKDTNINGIKYACYFKLANNYIIAFRKHSKKYGMQNMSIIKDSTAIQLTSDVDDNIGYSDIVPSPDNRFVYVSIYYGTLDIKDGITEIVRFGSGWILDIEKGKFVISLSAMEVGGNWTYCNQYIVNGEILFDPLKMEE